MQQQAALNSSIVASGFPARRETRDESFASASILIFCVSLIVLGVVMVFSASTSLDNQQAPENPLSSLPVRQALFSLGSIVVMWITYLTGHRWMRWRGPALLPDAPDDPDGGPRPIRIQPAVVMLAVVVLCLAAALVPGIGAERHGARRWLQVGPAHLGLGFQPSELAKIGLIVFLAAWLAHRPLIIKKFWTGILPAVGLVAGVVGLIVIEDFGTAALLALVGGVMIMAAGARVWHAMLLAVPALAGFGAMILAEPYRLERIVGFRNMWDDPLGKGYHAIQSLVTIASGGLWGRGLGAGWQKLGYLPEAHTDFIFVIICEELGLVGGFAVLCLYLCIIVLGWRVVVAQTDLFAKLLALGITLLFGFQAAINIAVVTASVPTKGISLPLVSAGGSGVLTYAFLLALLASVAATSSRQQAVDAFSVALKTRDRCSGAPAG